MATVAVHAENGSEPDADLASLDLDSLARRRFVILCVVYLVVGLGHAVWFATGDFARIREEAATAAVNLDAIHAETDVTPTSLSLADDEIRRLDDDVDEMERRLRIARNNPTRTEGDASEAQSTLAHREERVRQARQSLDDARTRRDAIARDVGRLAEAQTADIAGRRNVRRSLGRLAGFGLGVLVIGWFVGFQRRRAQTRQQVVSASTAMIVSLGGLLLASRLLAQPAISGLSTWGIVDIFTLNLLACMILPWTLRESLMPSGLLLLVWGVTFLVPQSADMGILDRVVVLIISPIALAPGAALAAWRWKRNLEDAERLRLGEQVRTLGGELSRARLVHDSLFPDPIATDQVLFMYEYRPSQEIGGDYVHLHVCRGSGRFYLTVLDVAGHGLTAALTVNRLFGELERIRAEDPDAEPALVMQLLNRYINLTMAPHNLYATGLCLMLDPSTGDIKWTNAGHPPALVRKADGRVLDLPGTTMLLGALTWDEFESNQKETSISPGDVVLFYTDGAFEARNAEGRQFGLDNIRKTAEFSPPPRDWTKFIANAVATYHGGHPEDDVLIAALHLKSLRVGGVAAASTETSRPMATTRK